MDLRQQQLYFLMSPTVEADTRKASRTISDERKWLSSRTARVVKTDGSRMTPAAYRKMGLRVPGSACVNGTKHVETSGRETRRDVDVQRRGLLLASEKRHLKIMNGMSSPYEMLLMLSHVALRIVTLLINSVSELNSTLAFYFSRQLRSIPPRHEHSE